MIWRNIARLARSAVLQGVQEPGPVDVVAPVQTVQIYDDASHLTPPVQVPHGIITAVVGAVAGQRSALQITAGGRGLWVEWIQRVGAGAAFSCVGFMTPTRMFTGAAVPTTWTPPFLSAFRSGSFAAAAIPTAANTLVINFAPNEIGRFLAPSEILVLCGNADNTQFEVSVKVQEVP